jgi:hypothetical protein
VQVSARSFLFPVHVSLTFLFTPTLGAALYLLLVSDPQFVAPLRKLLLSTLVHSRRCCRDCGSKCL